MSTSGDTMSRSEAYHDICRDIISTLEDVHYIAGISGFTSGIP